MKKYLAVTLGIVAALGGFVEIGDLVFNAQAGARFGYSLLWALAVGTVGIMVYGEMSGRVAAVAKKTAFDLIRDQYPRQLGFFTLVVSMCSNLLTCAAEIGGVALVLALLSGFSYPLLVVMAVLAIAVILWVLPFSGIEKLFGYLGVGLVVFLVAAIKTFPGGTTAMGALAPHVAQGSDWLTYAYMAVGIIAATMVPYEVYFYSSGGIEDKWKAKDGLTTNRMNSIVGFGLGAVVAASIMIVSAHVLLPVDVVPGTLGQTALTVVGPLGQAGLIAVLLGMLFAIGGAAVEAAFAGAYTLSQYAGWTWGKRHRPREALAGGIGGSGSDCIDRN
jgi:manganese transport protein